MNQSDDAAGDFSTRDGRDGEASPPTPRNGASSHDLVASRASGAGAEDGAAGAGESRSGAHSADLGFADLTPLFATRDGEGAAEPPRGRLSTIVNYGANAAFVLAVLGFAFAAGTYFFGSQDQQPSQAALRESAERAETLRRTKQVVEEIGALKANVEALRASVAQTQAGKDPRSLEKSVDGLKAKLDSIKSETAASLSELAAKVDRIQRDPGLKQMSERLERIEKQTALPTGSIAPTVKAATRDRVDAAPKTQPADAGRRPQLITSWIVREVYGGVALIENARGSMEVAPGDTIPGAGVVRSIERRGPGWIVITSRGLVDYDHGLIEP